MSRVNKALMSLILVSIFVLNDQVNFLAWNYLSVTKSELKINLSAFEFIAFIAELVKADNIKLTTQYH